VLPIGEVRFSGVEKPIHGLRGNLLNVFQILISGGGSHYSFEISISF